MKMIVQDGHRYESESDVPDLGSWQPTCSAKDQRRSYMGLSADVSKLPAYDDLLTGSSALCLDTGDLYIYHAETKKWYAQ